MRNAGLGEAQLESKLLGEIPITSDIGSPGGSEVKVSAFNVGDQGSIPGLGRSPGEGNGNLLQCSCLENPMEGGAWWATVHGITKRWTRLSNFTSLQTLSSVYHRNQFLNGSIFNCPFKLALSLIY